MQRQFLFSKMQSELIRLREMDSTLNRYYPRTDFQVQHSYGRLSVYEGDEDDSDEDDPENSYNLQKAFRKQWSYMAGADYKDKGGSLDGQDVKWHSSDLFFDLPDSDLKLRDLSEGSASWLPSEVGYFSQKISSQLLQYCITVTFDAMIPPTQTDGYKVCWVAFLQYEDKVSVLNLYDWKGGIGAHFGGTAEGSVEALKLLNFLCGMKCPHNYDYVLAGRIA